jgi:hypothetical protein
VSSASSSGSVTWTDAVSELAGDGDGDAVGDGLACCCDTVVFELLGAGAQLVSKIKNHERIKSRRIMVILTPRLRVSAVIQQRAFQ